MENSDSLGTKSCRKRLWDYLGGARVKTNMAEFSAECHSVDCSGDSKVLKELDSNKIKITVLDNQKSREVRRIQTRVPLFIYMML